MDKEKNILDDDFNINFGEKLNAALDRLEVYFKKREEVINDDNLNDIEKNLEIDSLRIKYVSELRIENLLN